MAWLTPEQAYWIIQPLVHAGLDLDEIRTLVVRLGFDSIVTDGRGTVESVTNVVRDQPVEIQAAWAKAVGRMIMPDETAPGE